MPGVELTAPGLVRSGQPPAYRGICADRGPRRGGSHELCLVLGPIRRHAARRRDQPGNGASDPPYIESMTESLRQAGDGRCCAGEGASTTGSELLAAIDRYARTLESLGIARGDLVAMYAPNRPEALALRYATHLLGAASVYLSAPPDPGKRAQMLVDFRPRLVVVFAETAHLLPPTPRPAGRLAPSRRSRSTSTNWRAGRTRPRWRAVPVRATSPWWCPPRCSAAARSSCRAHSSLLPPSRIAAVVSWPGRTVDTAGCLDTITGAFGPSVASTVVVLPVDWIPLTEQGKPNRPEIRRLGRELAAAIGR
jgi:hypothetical protein